MEKNFDSWNQVKKRLDTKIIDRNLFFHEREVWWCSLGINIGVESNGKNENFERPVLIIKKFNANMIWTISLTSKVRSSEHFRKIDHEFGPSWACLTQIKNISTKRLLRKIGMVNQEDFESVLLGLSDYLKIETPPTRRGISEAEATNELSIIQGENKSTLCYNFPMNHLITITKADGTKELFEESKLIDSLKNAGGNDAIIEEVIDHVGKEMYDGMPTSEIYSRAFKLLRKHSMPMAVKYSLRRALSELGPDGFPFEKYIAKIFQAWEYETLTDQTVLGACVPHEVDVVAWNKEKLIMVEAKFHNELGMKSDIKVALYIKARFDDLKENMFDYGGKKRKLDEGWLVTNTKFTDQAIKYGECQKIKMLGWNYPQKGNLQDIIEELHLHPFTCLISLSNAHKKTLLSKGVVLCMDIYNNQHYLKDIGIKSPEAEEVIKEIKEVCGI